MAKTDDERKAFLTGLGLNPDAPALSAPPKTEKPAKPKAQAAQVPEGVDPHTMKVSDIKFDESLLDEFQDLSGRNYNLASQKIFQMYQSPGRDSERNGLLHRKITEFIGQVKRSRKTGGFVKEKIKATEQERELANLLATHNVTVEELAALLKEKA